MSKCIDCKFVRVAGLPRNLLYPTATVGIRYCEGLHEPTAIDAYVERACKGFRKKPPKIQKGG